MLLLVAGLLLFLLPHSIRVIAPNRRDALIAKLGEGGYKGAYSLVSLLGLVLLIAGYGAARAGSPVVYVPPTGLRHAALLLVPLSLVAVSAAYLPAGRIKAALRHPMVAGVALWSLGHLLANGSVADVVLFGAFLAWAVVDYASALRRDPHPVGAEPKGIAGDGAALAIGVVATALLLGGGHAWLFGVSPIG